MTRALPALVLVFAASLPLPASAASPPCLPCVGVTARGPGHASEVLSQAPALDEEARLYVRWRHRATDAFDAEPARSLHALGATPWVAVVFHTPGPLVENLAELDAELSGLAAIARDSGPLNHFEVVWEPRPPSDRPTLPSAPPVSDYAFLLKRAAVAITGARSDARVLTQPLAPDPQALRALYGQEVAAYVDGIMLQAPVSADAIAAVQTVLEELDPGRPLVIAGLPLPDPAALAVAQAADLAAAGVAMSLFDLPETPRSLAPLVVLANETQGDLAFDPYSTPPGGAARSFVRGSDLGLRVIARAPPGGPLQLALGDPQLGSPEVVDLESGEVEALFGQTRGPDGLRLRIEDPPPVVLLRLSRSTAGELDTVQGGAIDVATERQIPVEEILRRLQAFEDAQARRLSHYEGTNTTHLRFQGAGDTAVEVTFRGPIFFRQGGGFDWAWRDLYINGVKWRGTRLPEIPLLQPEKAAAMPLQVHFTREYTYRLRGTGEAEGRPAWVIDFEPADSQGAATEHLYQGTVWVDREHFGRLRTRALQVGLTGEVISNEEDLRYAPVDEGGQPAAWTPEAFWLPLRTVGQQLLSIVNRTTVVEREVLLTDLELNGADFDQQLAAVLATDVTMVRDTERGLRYLVKEKGGEGRVVKEGYDTSKLFLLGGVFYDDAFDFPIPLLGANYFSFDLRGTGTQANVFFGGALLQASVAQPKVRGTRWDAGADLFAIALTLDDEVFRDDREIAEETVSLRPASLGLKAGHPIGSFVRVGASYDLTSLNFSRADDTGDSFVLPSDHLLHSFELDARYSRKGYRLSLAGSYNLRSEWERWGLPDQPFDPETDDFVRWDVRLAKSWHLPRFQRLGIELDHVSGQDLDRFSKYQFGFFGATRVHGYSSNRVRAEEASLAHLSYGVGIGEIVRLDLVADAAWATDEASGLRDELLAGVGIAGSFMGPWQTVVQVDFGVPVAGPDDGFVAYLVFLKLFR
jgi:hypothetical protein